MTQKEALKKIAEIAHHAANGGHRFPGKSETIGPLKADLRAIRDLAQSTS